MIELQTKAMGLQKAEKGEFLQSKSAEGTLDHIGGMHDEIVAILDQFSSTTG